MNYQEYYAPVMLFQQPKHPSLALSMLNYFVFGRIGAYVIPPEFYNTEVN